MRASAKKPISSAIRVATSPQPKRPSFLSLTGARVAWMNPFFDGEPFKTAFFTPSERANDGPFFDSRELRRRSAREGRVLNPLGSVVRPPGLFCALKTQAQFKTSNDGPVYVL